MYHALYVFDPKTRLVIAVITGKNRKTIANYYYEFFDIQTQYATFVRDFSPGGFRGYAPDCREINL